MKPKTYHEGASDERKAILAKLRRDKRQTRGVRYDYLDELIDWILKRDERYNARPGGLGRKRKAK